MENKQKTGRLITLTAIKTIIAFVIILFFVCLGVYVINPRFAAEVVGKIGWTSAEVNCYELVYTRSKSTSDLYNLIVKMDNTKNYGKQNEYIAKLMGDPNYLSFCDSMNTSVVTNFNNGNISKKNLALLYGVNEYVTSKKILNLVRLENWEGAYKVAVDSKDTDQNFEISLYYYVDYLLSDQVSEQNRTKYLKMLLDNGDILENLNTRYNSMDQGAENSARKIVSSYAKVKIRYTEYVIYKNADSPETEEAFKQWQTELAVYNNLIKG